MSRLNRSLLHKKLISQLISLKKPHGGKWLLKDTKGRE